MKPSQLAVLGGVAVAALVVGILLNAPGTRGSRVAGVGDLLTPGLDAALNDVTGITLRGEDATVTLTRGERGWGVAEKGGYPAQVGRVREFLLALASASLLEAKTSDPERYAALGVQAVEDGGVAVTVTTAAGPVTESPLLIGDSARAGSATYARRADEAGSWLVSGDLDVSVDATKWLDTLVTDIAASRVQSVTIEHEDGGTLRIAKTGREARAFDVENVPEDRSLRYDSIANPIGGALAALRLEDVMARDEMGGDVSPVATARFLTFDGLEVTATTWKGGEARYVTIAAAFDQAQAERFAAAPDSGDTDAPDAAGSGDSDGADTGDGGPAGADVATQAEALDASRTGWVYAIGSYKFDQLTRRMEDLLAPVEDESAVPEAG
jgi:hypothetical protein